MTNTFTRKFPIKLFYGIIFICSLSAALIFSEEISVGIIEGMNIAVHSIIPNTFVFAIVSDALYSYVCLNGLGKIGKLFARVFSVSEVSASAILLGSFSGFPIGAMMLSQAHLNGKIAKEEAEYSLAPATSPSFIFCLSVLGELLGDKLMGINLYLICVLSSFITALCFKYKTSIILKTNVKQEQRFSLINSIKKSALNSIYIIAFIIFFSAISSVLLFVLPKSFFSTFAVSILEIGKGVKLLSVYRSRYTFPALAFALSFTGISAMLQVKGFCEDALSIKRYLFMKTVSAAIALLISSLYVIIK